MNNLAEEFIEAIFMGRTDTQQAIDKYMTKLKSAGLDKVMAEMQKQVDAWKITKK